MSRYFMRDTDLAGLESAMMLPPLFKPRHSGLAILNRFRYYTVGTHTVKVRAKDVAG